MKNFFQAVLANIVAIFLFLISIFVVLLLFIAVSSIFSDSKPTVQSNSVLTISNQISIIDSPNEETDDPFNFNNNGGSVLVYDIVNAINLAKNDDKIKGISIESDMLSGGITQIDNIRAAILDFKKSGKFVTAYGNAVSQPAYLLSTAADEIYLNPVGGIELKGMNAEIMFFKNFFDKYGISVEIIRHGNFKAAVEPFMRNDMSEENKLQMTKLLSDIWSNSSQKMANGRKISLEDFNIAVDSLYGVLPELCIKNGLVDKLLQKSQYEEVLKKKLKINVDKDVRKISISKYIKAKNTESGNSEKIAILYASGNILDGKGQDNIYEKDFIEYIKKIADNKKIKAVVLRVNSPGGSANASDQILFELNQLKAKKPLVVSFGDYAASGGYYIAMAGQKIYAEPNTITGSIGVFGMIPYFKELANKNGVTTDVVKTNANSNMYSPVNGLSDGTVNVLSKNVEYTYKRFVNFVSKNRNMSYMQVDALGSGRVWSGTAAKKNGLVDELGSLEDAVKYAAKVAKLKDYGVSSYPKKVDFFQQFMKDLEGEEDISSRILKKNMTKEQFYLYKQITNPSMQNKVQMQLPFSIKW